MVFLDENDIAAIFKRCQMAGGEAETMRARLAGHMARLIKTEYEREQREFNLDKFLDDCGFSTILGKER